MNGENAADSAAAMGHETQLSDLPTADQRRAEDEVATVVRLRYTQCVPL